MPSSLALLILIFAVAAAAVWGAGIQLSKTTDVLDHRLGLGEALGGVILLAITTNLPEIAITASAALAHDLGIAIGNILGGIAIQTVVLALLDFRLGRRTSLTYQAASLQLVVEGALVCALLAVVVMGTQLPSSFSFWRLEAASIAIVVLWVLGIWLVARARTGLPWHAAGNPPDSEAQPRGTRMRKQAEQMSVGRAGAIFVLAAAVTLAGGVALERSGERIADHVGMTGVLFGATVLAAATALPEVSTGLASVKIGDYQLAVSDIFGGNAFLPVLFLMANLLSGDAVLPLAHDTDIYLTALGIVLTIVYIYGLIFRPRKRFWRLGPDSSAVVLFYALGLIGLVFVNR